MSIESLQVVSFGDAFHYKTKPDRFPGPYSDEGRMIKYWTWTDAEVTTLKVNEVQTDGRTTFAVSPYNSKEDHEDQKLDEEATLINGTGTPTVLPMGTKVALGPTGTWVTTPKLDASGAVETDDFNDPILLKYLFSFLTDANDPSITSPPLNGAHTYVVVAVDHSVPFDPSMTLTYVTAGWLKNEDYAVNYQGSVCFTPGTQIDTPDGPCLVEDIVAGTSVTTRDRGVQPVVWVGRQSISAMGLDQRPNLRPIRIRAGAFGPNRPEREMLLSPQHRVLARGDVVRHMFGEPEVLVPAKLLTALEGVDAVCPTVGITYIHLLLNQHELLWADGIWAESLLTGPQALKSLSPAAYREITGIFPHLREITERPPSVRPLINGQRGRRLAEQCAKNNKAFQTS